MRKGGSLAVREAGRFFEGKDPVHAALRKVAARLGEAGFHTPSRAEWRSSLMGTHAPRWVWMFW
jgi:hypothetical protein